MQLFVLNEEFLVSARHQRALITSLPFVHTARRCYRLDVLVSFLESPRSVSEEGVKETKLECLEEAKVVTRSP